MGSPGMPIQEPKHLSSQLGMEIDMHWLQPDCVHNLCPRENEREAKPTWILDSGMSSSRASRSLVVMPGYRFCWNNACRASFCHGLKRSRLRRDPVAG